jgi:hypothetical protein
MPVLLDELLSRIPSDTRQRVERARDRFNPLIREALRRETGLRLKRPGVQEDSDARKEEAVVRTVLEPGLPAKLQGKVIEDRYRLAAILAPWRHTLHLLRDSSREINEKLVPLLLSDPAGSNLMKERQRHLRPVGELAEDLLREIAKFDLVKWILAVDEDVLGVYRYREHEGFLGIVYEGHIELYWSVIGLIAQLIDTSVEALASVVFAHELAHAFTHVGADIDGHRWPSKQFDDGERGLVEGLAQYYTALVCDRLDRHDTYARDAYQKLLPHQPGPYHSQEKWLREFTPEEVRLAMIETRRKGAGTVGDFEKSLGSAQERLRKQAKA